MTWMQMYAQKLWNFTTCKMKYASIFFNFSYFLQILMIYFHVAQYPCMLKATLLKIIKKLPKNRNSKLDSKLKNSNSTRLDWKFLQLILSSTRLDPKICQLDSTRFDKFSTRSTPNIDAEEFQIGQIGSKFCNEYVEVNNYS